MAKIIKIIFNNEQSATYKFVDNIVGETMYDLMNHVVKQNQNDIHNQHGSFPTFDDFARLQNYLVELVNQAETFGIELQEVPEVITQEDLSRIHEGFHLVEEVYLADKNLDPSNTVRECLREINNTVHALEAKFNTHKNNYWVWQVGNTTYHKRTVINAVLREQFKPTWHGNHTTDLRVGYATIGKNLLHCYTDNDVELVKQNHLRPQLSMSTETIWGYNIDSQNLRNGLIIKHWRNWQKDIKQWIVDNDLQNNVGAEDPIHLHSFQPTYAIPTGDCETWELQKWHDCFVNHGLKAVELE